MDHDAYEHYIEDLCMNKTRLFDTVLKISPELMDDVQVSMSNPFKKQLGQLTVYRIRLHFRKEQCQTTDASQCSMMKENDRLLPYHQQLWPAYMGIRGDSRANPRWSFPGCSSSLNSMWYSLSIFLQIKSSGIFRWDQFLCVIVQRKEHLPLPWLAAQSAVWFPPVNQNG